mgnify:FL=1
MLFRSITYSWLIDNMTVYPSKDGLSNVVMQVNCVRQGVSGQYKGVVFCSVSLPPPGADFVPYDQLTKNEVLGWLNLNPEIVAGYDSQIQASIENQINPPIQVLPVPWSNNG